MLVDRTLIVGATQRRGVTARDPPLHGGTIHAVLRVAILVLLVALVEPDHTSLDPFAEGAHVVPVVLVASFVLHREDDLRLLSALEALERLPARTRR